MSGSSRTTRTRGSVTRRACGVWWRSRARRTQSWGCAWIITQRFWKSAGMNSGALAAEKNMKNKTRLNCGLLVAAALLGLVAIAGGLTGCATLDRAYQQEVTWTNTPV